MNVTANRLPERAAALFVRWGWFGVLMYFTGRLMSIEAIQERVRALGSSTLTAYIVAAVIGGIVGIGYLAIINNSRVRLEGKGSAPTQTELLNWQRGDPNDPPRIGYTQSVQAGILLIRFIVENPSAFPAYDISVRVWDIENLPKDPAGLEDILSRSIAIANIPSLAPNTIQIIGQVEVPLTVTSKKFGAQFTTRVGGFHGNINAQKINGTWLFAVRMRRFDASGEVVFQEVNPGFPLNKDGDVDW